MDLKKNKIKYTDEIDSFLDSYRELSETKKNKSLELYSKDFIIGNSQNIFEIDSDSQVHKSNKYLIDRLDEISNLIKENTIGSSEINSLKLNQRNIFNEIKTVQYQNENLFKEVNSFKQQNDKLKELLLKNTSDRRIRSVASAFLVLFTFSFIMYYLTDYELVKVIWAKIGIVISIGVYFIGFFIGKMIKKNK